MTLREQRYEVTAAIHLRHPYKDYIYDINDTL